MTLKILATHLVLCSVLVGSTLPGLAHAQQTSVTTEPPPVQDPKPPASSEPCPKGNRGGAVGGIVVGSVFWWLLPMSIPLWVTQSRKLKAHNKARLERRCQYAPGS